MNKSPNVPADIQNNPAVKFVLQQRSAAEKTIENCDKLLTQYMVDHLPEDEMNIMLPDLTSTQDASLCFIVHNYISNGASPTLREIMNHMGWHWTNSASNVVAALERKGYLQKTKHGRRSIVPLYNREKRKVPSNERKQGGGV
tara:strand:- start:72 stop:500 length:429 start_codon:yes stop_codon:yes gene_type:complete